MARTNEKVFPVSEAEEAIVEFQKVADHPAATSFRFPTGALMQIELGIARAMDGDTAKAKMAYQEFFGLWKNAMRMCRS